MSDTVREWLRALYQNEIDEVTGYISKERIWEREYEGPNNPCTQSILEFSEYLDVLEEKLSELY